MWDSLSHVALGLAVIFFCCCAAIVVYVVVKAAQTLDRNGCFILLVFLTALYPTYKMLYWLGKITDAFLFGS